MKTGIQLIVGLGNPGAAYAYTRHNAGAWLINSLSEQTQTPLAINTKCHGQLAQITFKGHKVRLLIPGTYMNLSGQALQATAHYFKIPSDAILVAHDEVDFEPGTIKIKIGGGHGGHNGLRNIHQALGTANYTRLRIGIGHPGNKNKVHDYVLSKPNNTEKECIDIAINNAIAVLPQLLEGDIQNAMHLLHTKSE